MSHISHTNYPFYTPHCLYKTELELSQIMQNLTFTYHIVYIILLQYHFDTFRTSLFIYRIVTIIHNQRLDAIEYLFTFTYHIVKIIHQIKHTNFNTYTHLILIVLVTLSLL